MRNAVFFQGQQQMKFFRLPPGMRQKLIGLPETGMGYQKVTVTMKDGRVLRDMTVCNCEDMLVPDNFPGGEVVNVSM